MAKRLRRNSDNGRWSRSFTPASPPLNPRGELRNTVYELVAPSPLLNPPGEQRNTVSELVPQDLPNLLPSKTPASPLLTLPGELRNSVYEFVAQDLISFSLGQGRKSNTPVLSLVCRQVREEFKQVYIDVLKYAPRIDIHITNFIWNGMNGHPSASVPALIASLPPVSPSVERRYTLHIHLTSTWGRSRSQIDDIITDCFKSAATNLANMQFTRGDTCLGNAGFNVEFQCDPYAKWFSEAQVWHLRCQVRQRLPRCELFSTAFEAMLKRYGWPGDFTRAQRRRLKPSKWASGVHTTKSKKQRKG